MNAYKTRNSCYFFEEKGENLEPIMDQFLTKPNESSTNANSMPSKGNVEYTTSESILTAESHHHHHHHHNHNQQVKYCADFKPIKDLFNKHIEQFYKPVISLLPEDFQLLLLDETHIAGLNTAACLLIMFSLTVLLSVWYVYLKRKQKEQHMQTVRLNEKMLIIENSLKKMTFEKQTFESEYNDLEMKYADVHTRFNERDEKLKQASDMCAQLTHTNSLNQKEIEKLKTNETKLNKEMTMLKVELANSKQQTQNEMEEYEMRMNNLNVDHQVRVNDLSSRLSQSQYELESKSQLVNQLELQLNYFKVCLLLFLIRKLEISLVKIYIHLIFDPLPLPLTLFLNFRFLATICSLALEILIRKIYYLV